jgi:uncharacterized membrane protein
MRTSDKKLLFLVLPSLCFLVCLLLVASEASPKDGRLLVSMILFIFGLINSYGIFFNGYVMKTGGDSNNSKDDEYGLRNFWGGLGILCLIGSFLVLFL